MRIGHASIDENGKIAGGKMGDQTAKEICIRPWYDKDWDYYLECKDQSLADKAASIMEQICNDNNFGYDQSERLTGYQSIIKNKGMVRGAEGEFDCSSLVSTCYNLVGVKVSVSNTTRSLRADFMKTGLFVEHHDDAHLKSDKLAKRGCIYLKEGSHVVMGLDTSRNPYPVPTRILKEGLKGEDVKWLQYELGIDVDGDYGSLTEKAVADYQTKQFVTGVLDPVTKIKILG